jgi:hypothetical protein
MFLFFITRDFSDPVDDTTSMNSSCSTVAHRFTSLADRSHESSNVVKVPAWDDLDK